MRTSTPLSADLEDFLHGLASQTRQKILFEVFVGGGEHTVGQIAGRTGLGQSTASEHLAILKRAGILTSRREGKEVYYRPNRERVLEQLSKLTTLLNSCCQS